MTAEYRARSRSPLALAAGLVALTSSAGLAQSSPGPEEVLAGALEAMNADLLVEEMRHVTADITGEAWMLEQSGTLDGGWIRLDQTGHIQLDLVERRGEVQQSRTVPAWEGTPYGQWTVRFAPEGAAMSWPGEDGEISWNGARSSWVREARRYLDLFPAALIRQGLAAEDLRLDDSGNPVFSRDIHGASEEVTLLLDTGSGAVTGFRLRSRFDDDLMLVNWGESIVEGEYGFWWRDERGGAQPRQLQLTFNGRPWMRYELNGFTWSAEGPEHAYAIAAAGQGGPNARSMDAFPFSQQHEQITQRIRAYHGAWNVAVVDQGDGLVILDAPISGGYVRALLAQLETDFPGRPVKAVVSTSSAWPHAGGVAAIAEAGVPLYVHPANRRLVEGFAVAAGFDGQITDAVDGQSIGEGEGEVVLRFAPGPELSEMMFAVVPGQALVWGSDAPQLAPGETVALLPHARQYVAEMFQAVCADLTADTNVYAMHAGPLPAADLLAAYDSDARPPCRLSGS